MLKYFVQPANAVAKCRQMYHLVAKATNFQQHAYIRDIQTTDKQCADEKAEVLAIHVGAQ
jgi:hypothetical protein